MRLDIQIFIDIVTKILFCFLREIKNKTLKRGKYPHIDVKLTKHNESCFIYVTNCGDSNGNVANILMFIFSNIRTGILLENYFRMVTVFIKRSNDELVCESRIQGNTFEKLQLVNAENINYTYLKEYISFRLQCTLLIPKDIECFQELLIKILLDIQKNYPNVKYTFHYGDELIYKNEVELDKDFANCKILSSAITTIIQGSFNRDFRERCFSLFEINNSYDTENAVMSRLIPLIYDNYETLDNEGNK